MGDRARGGIRPAAAAVPAFRDRRLVPAAIAVWAGCWWGTSGVLGWRGTISIALLLSVVAILLVVWRRYEDRQRPRPRHCLVPAGSLRLSLALVCVATAGACLLGTQARIAYEADPFHSAFASRHSLECDVEITGYPRAHNTGSSLSHKDVTFPARTLRLYFEGGRTVASSVEVRIRGKGMMAFQRGDLLRVRVKAAARQRLVDPVAAQVQLTRLISRTQAQGIAAIPARIRADTHVLLADAPPHTRGLIPGLAMGDRSALPHSLNEAMRVASLSHLSAISGMHIAVLLAAVAVVVPGRGVLRVGAILCALSVIVVLAGPTPSVLRAVTMAGIGVWGLFSRRFGQGVTSLAVAGIVMLYADPWNARSFSFALSIMATAGVVTYGQRWKEWATRHFRRDTVSGRMASLLHGLVSVPLAAQLWVMPVLILMEAQLPLWGVGANVAASPIVAPLTVLSLVVCLSAPPWPGLAEGLARLAEPLCGWVDLVARTSAALPGAQVSWIKGIDGALLWCVMLMTASGGIKVVARVGHWRRRPPSANTTH